MCLYTLPARYEFVEILFQIGRGKSSFLKNYYTVISNKINTVNLIAIGRRGGILSEALSFNTYNISIIKGYRKKKIFLFKVFNKAEILYIYVGRKTV